MFVKENPDKKKSTKFYSREVLGIPPSAKINPRKKKIKIGILENKFTRKLILFKQSNLLLQSFLIQNLCLTKISNMILTQFQAILQFYTP